MGYSAKEQLSTKPTGIITFQWDSCNGDSVLLNSGMIVPSVTTINSYEGQTMIPNWYLGAPKIQVRMADGGYAILYYCSDAYNNDTGDTVAGWSDTEGNLDTTTTVDVNGGFWLNQPNGDQKIYVTVKNPVK